MIKLVCFSALTFAGSLGKSLNIQRSGLMFKQLPRDPANVIACEPQHDKTNKMSVCPAKTQISLGIRPV